MTDSNVLLKVRGLTKHFNINNNWFSKPLLLHAVDDMNFDLTRGETLGLSGKAAPANQRLPGCC